MKGRIREVDCDETSPSEGGILVLIWGTLSSTILQGYTVHLVSESGDSESETEMPSHGNFARAPIRIEELTDQNRGAEGMECDWNTL